MDVPDAVNSAYNRLNSTVKHNGSYPFPTVFQELFPEYRQHTYQRERMTVVEEALEHPMLGLYTVICINVNRKLSHSINPGPHLE